MPRLQSAVSGTRNGQRIPICKNDTQVNFLTKWRNQKSRGTTIKHRRQRRVPPWRQASRQLADGSRCELRSCVLFIINSVLLQIDTNIQAKKGTLSANNEVWGRGVEGGGWFCLMPTQTSLTTPPLTTCLPPLMRFLFCCLRLDVFRMCLSVRHLCRVRVLLYRLLFSNLCTCTSFAVLPSLLVINKALINGPVHNSEDESIPNVKNKD